MEELDTTLKAIKNKKSPNFDNIPGEVCKSNALKNELLQICNKVYNGEIPSIWTKSCIIPIPKKGDLGLASNYRGISLICIAAKIYNKLLLNRIRPHIDPILRKNQNGFRQNRSTVAQVLTLRGIIEGIKSKSLEATLVFIDFKKEFDSTHRSRMLEILKAYGIPEKIVRAIGIMYSSTEAKVRVEEAAKQIGLHINVSKTEYISIKEHGQILSSSGDPISKSEDFQCLGSWIMTTKRDIEVRIAKAWAAHNKLRTIWNSNMSRKYKINFFRATVESILLYGAESWTLTKALENRSEELIQDVLFWEPPHGRRPTGRPPLNYINNLIKETGLTIQEMQTKMSDRMEWRKLVMLSRNNPD
eukprot:gene1285-1417_t